MTIDINVFELESVDLWENSKSFHLIVKPCPKNLPPKTPNPIPTQSNPVQKTN